MTADCACGGIISARSEVMIPVAVLAHNGSLLHAIWRRARGDTGGPYDPRCHWPTAADQPVDAAQGDDVIREGDRGASAAGAEG